MQNRLPKNELPHQVMYRLKNDEMIIRTRDQEVEKLRQHFAAQQRKNMQTMMGTGLLVISALLLPDIRNLSSMPVGWQNLKNYELSFRYQKHGCADSSLTARQAIIDYS